MPLAFQAKLLRTLQTGTILPVGSTQPIHVDCRIVSACHRNLAEAVAQGEFREDLYYRLNVLSIELPPLRDRDNDVVALAQRLLSKIALEEHTLACKLSINAVNSLKAYSWPGNVRELENILRRAAILYQGMELHDTHLALGPISKNTQKNIESDITPIGIIKTSGKTLKELENHIFESTIAEHKGCIDAAAKSLGIAPSTLYRRIKKTVL